ncbi:hypothetical protein [Hamadaea tsunoensis]|uniref:hypothetical protein n=1 Tax=Hamadaea tsunoensis TaxID=53368 RepID=UPI00068806E9|nr:hypothetical protein [Hamadaea tsunoensis]
MNTELMPAMMEIDGCIGLSCLAERETGRCIATSAWRSMETMRASANQVTGLRERLISTMRAKDPLIQEWEIPLMHRYHAAPEGACARLSWLQGSPANLDNAIESFRMITPELDDLTGFCSASLLVNQDTGLACATVVYEDADAVARTRQMGTSLRTQVAEQANAKVIEVAEFELAMAHLHVPELV